METEEFIEYLESTQVELTDFLRKHGPTLPKEIKKLIYRLNILIEEILYEIEDKM